MLIQKIIKSTNSLALKKRSLAALFLTGALSAFTALTHAQTAPQPTQPTQKQATTTTSAPSNRGWFFFDDPTPPPPPASDPPPAPPAPEPAAPPPTPSEIKKCSNKKTWSTECGFVEPGEDFDFQAQQRDALFQRMVVAKNSPKDVENVQRYMNWAMERASEIANLWVYNTIQKPELDPNVKNPVSSFGLKLMSDIQSTSDTNMFATLRKEGAFFVVFTRESCAFCHQMQSTFETLSSDTGLPLHNATLEKTCMSYIKGDCIAGPQAIAAAQALQVATVPSVFLYVPKNTWLRIGTGVVDSSTLKNRTTQFFTAYRNALLQGVNNSTSSHIPSVSFSKDPNATGTATGVETTTEMDTEQKVRQLMAAPATTRP